MYDIFTYIYPNNHWNVAKCSIHGASGHCNHIIIILWQIIKQSPELNRKGPEVFQGAKPSR